MNDAEFLDKLEDRTRRQKKPFVWLTQIEYHKLLMLSCTFTALPLDQIAQRCHIMSSYVLQLIDKSRRSAIQSVLNRLTS